MSLKIGFYICHCGINIAYRVRVEEVAAFAAKLQNVVTSRDYKFMCSDPGQEMIENDIKTFGLNRVVVASCSPRLHEKTFKNACQRAGLNPYYFQMASVREQVSWVTKDEDEATRKAKTLVAAAINRVNYHERLETRTVSVLPDILVVGAGIAGMQAALDIAASGHKVYLVEKDTTIGGHMLQFDKTFPTLDCAACIGTPKMVEVAQHPNIELLSYSEVTEVTGFIGNFNVHIHRKPRYIKEGVCTGCGECVTVCPVERPSEWDQMLGKRRAIYRAFPQALPITFCIDKKDRAPCVGQCPAHANVQGYVQLLKQEKYVAAWHTVQQRVPLPGVLGRICPHTCETVCRRQEVDEPVAIRELKRFIADKVDIASLEIPEIADKPQQVAVIGAGPAGLTAAFDLRKLGYGVTIFEALPELGGMLRVGIPDYRLPSPILNQEIDYLLRHGIQTKTGMRLGRDFTLADLMQQGFEAVFLGLGVHGAMQLRIEGEDAQGVLDAVRFLREVNLGQAEPLRGDVIVIGGGNVAIDVARTALRQGAASVRLLCLESRNTMPAWESEVQEALEEGVIIDPCWSPQRILQAEGRATGVAFIRCLSVFDENGAFNPTTDPGISQEIQAQTVIVAIGQRAEADVLAHLSQPQPDGQLVFTRRSTLEVRPGSGQTPLPHVFAAGDMVSGPATVIEAIGAAHQVAEAMDRFLQGLPLEEAPAPPAPAIPWDAVPHNLDAAARARSTHRSAAERCRSFDEVNLGLQESGALQEAERCLNCGGCSECMECVSACEPKAIDHLMQPTELDINVGAIILATGFDLLDPTPMQNYGYGQFPNVITSLEFERLSNATGPTSGRILMRNDKREFIEPPQSVALLHCIGSRDVNYHTYCSRVCCMYALKYSHLLKEKVGHHVNVYDFYIDQRCYGKGYEEFYRRCQEEGTEFVRGKVAEVTDYAENAAEEGKLICVAEDTLLGQIIRVPVDMVVLCAAMEARKDTPQVGRLFGVNTGADGFFLEEHPKLGPLTTASDGIYLAGACQSPKDVPDTVAQASGAAAKALALVTRGYVEIPSAISHIDADICIGCQVCIGLCPYGAIEFNTRLGISCINEALCKGCGSCAGYCPSGAAQIRHFKEKQIFAEVDGLFDAIYRVGT